MFLIQFSKLFLGLYFSKCFYINYVSKNTNTRVRFSHNRLASASVSCGFVRINIIMTVHDVIIKEGTFRLAFSFLFRTKLGIEKNCQGAQKQLSEETFLRQTLFGQGFRVFGILAVKAEGSFFKFTNPIMISIEVSGME